jgi:hypothetical protein
MIVSDVSIVFRVEDGSTVDVSIVFRVEDGSTIVLRLPHTFRLTANVL